jgi:hypothetical protein
MRAIVSTILLSLFVLASCGGGVDKVDVGSLKDGATHTAKLKFWAKGRSAIGNDLVENVHFDDAANARLVFYFDPALKDTVAALEQGKPYAVTFNYKGGDPLFKGTMTAVK